MHDVYYCQTKTSKIRKHEKINMYTIQVKTYLLSWK